MKRRLEKVPWLQSVCSGVLICALLLSICLPLMGMKAAEPENPILQAAPQEITVLQAGQGRGSSGNGETESQRSEGSGGSKTDETVEGEQEQPDPEETENQTEQGQDTQPEQQPQGKPQQEVLAEAEIGTNTDSDQGEEGEEVGETGEEEEELPAPELDLGAVLTWYKYGSQASSMVCAPEKSVGKRVLLAQLDNGKLRYDVELSGLDADDAEITDVQLAVGNGRFQDVDARGAIEMELPDGAEYQNYILSVSAHAVQKDQKGETVETDVEFTFILRLESGIDLDLQLTWEPNGQATCGANATVNRTVKSDTLTDGLFIYNLEFLGTSADDAQIKSASYWSNSDSGDLEMSGEIQMKVPDGRDTETYYLAVTAEVLGQTIDYTFVITYEDGLDLQLQFTWYEKSVTAQQVLCKADDRAALTIKHNQVSNSELLYKLGLTGKSALDAQIVSAVCDGSEISTDSGSIALQTTENGANYVVLVTAKVGDRTVRFEIRIRYQSDVALEMAYTVTENGAAKACVLTCENKKTVRAEDVYDDQLTDGLLSYTLSLKGEETQGIEITSVTCYQSGDFRTKTLTSPTGNVTMLLAADGKTGENTFTVKASGGGQEYTFTLSLPYKHRGDQEVKIECSLENVDSVASGQPLEFEVRAWTEDASGKKTYILSSGLDTILSVKLDGEACIFAGTASGNWQQYEVERLKAPEKGDTIDYTLVITAEDAFGNKGEKTLTLHGVFAGDGQKLGEGTIIIDMGVIGLSSSVSISCDILAGEPASCTVAKAVWGYEAPEPFGKAERTLGWSASYDYDPMSAGFYLRGMDDGTGLVSRANALSGSWSDYGSTDEEVFAAIDARFGEGTSLDILWRCIYKKGIELRDAGGDLSEFDFTQGSGWLYEVNGVYYGYGMGKMTSLKKGDTVTLRYTLAYGADTGYTGGDVGACCVTYLGGGSWSGVSHDTQEVTVDGVTKTVCRRCGLESESGLCSHPEEHRKYVDQKNGTCAEVCGDCEKIVGEAKVHERKYTDNEDGATHTITCAHDCGFTEPADHILVEAEEQDAAKAPTCTQDGVVVYVCKDCGAKVEKAVAATGHKVDGWTTNSENKLQHVKRCSVCDTTVEGPTDHTFTWKDGSWRCSECRVRHEKICGSDDTFVCSNIDEQTHTLTCSVCGLKTEPQEHTLENGVCTVCDYGAEEPHEHTYTDWENAGNGYHYRTCPACGDIQEESHTFENGYCTVCGAKDPDTPDPVDPVDPVNPVDPVEPDTPDETEESGDNSDGGGDNTDGQDE